MTRALSPAEQRSFDAGDLVVAGPPGEAGSNWFATYQSRAFVEGRLLSSEFELVEHVEGRPDQNLAQDIYLLRKL